MTATQTQIRRGTSAQCDAVTFAEGEVIADLTNDRLRLGDGLLAGGHLQASAKDVQNNAFNAATAGGTGNAITVTLSPVPSGYVTHMGVTFKASAANTGAVTINVNSLGTRNLQKVAGGSLTALVSGDIVNGAYYTAIYDGTQFILQGSGGGVVSVGGAGGLTGTVTSSGNISIDTNNALGVGTIYLARPNTSIAAGATIAGSSLQAHKITGAGGALSSTVSGSPPTLSGTWRNISGWTLTTSDLGFFIRVS